MTWNKSLPLIVFALVLTAAAALYSLRSRYHVEARNRAVEIAVEYDTVASLAASQNMPVEGALSLLKAGGVQSAVLSEQTVGELVDRGEIQLRNDSTKNEVTLIGDPTAIGRAMYGYWVRFEKTGTEPPSVSQPNSAFIVPGLDPQLLRTTELGLDPLKAARIRDAALRIIARGGNPTGADAKAVRETVKWFHALGADVYLPEGDQVLGRRDNRDVFIGALDETHMLYASPEFAKIGGDANVVGEAPEKVVRLHSAQTAEMDKMTLADAVERYVRAGRERGIRILLVRPLTLSSEKPLDSMVDLIRAIGARLAREGGAVGLAKPFEAPGPDRWIFPVIGVGAALIALYAASMFFENRGVLLVVALASLAIGVGAWLPSVRGFTALMAAFSAPIAAFGILETTRHRTLILHYIVLVLASLVGGLAVAGLLNDLPYFVRAEQFEGVKLAHFGPIFMIGLFMSLRLIDWKGGLRSPITWIQAVLALLFLVALAFMFLRTGNDNPAAVSGFELKLRSLLDNILPVRPRTKEFVFGFPALVLGLGMLMQIRAGGHDGLRGWAVVSLMVGSIGTTSIVNTMCHLHTPLEVGFIRIAVGVILGGIIGAAVWLVVGGRIARTRTAS